MNYLITVPFHSSPLFQSTIPLHPPFHSTAPVRINKHASSAFRLLPCTLMGHCVWHYCQTSKQLDEYLGVIISSVNVNKNTVGWTYVVSFCFR